MSIPAGPSLPRRAFLEGLLVAAWGGEGIVKAAGQAGKAKGQQAEVPAPGAADARVPRLEDSGMRPKLLAQVRGLLARPHGLILCCGPTAPIRTAAVYACLRELDPARKKIFTVEDLIAYRLAGITQRAIDVGGGETYAGVLRSALERAPDAIMIGEIRDPETATIACRASAKGPLILAGFQANDTILALLRLLEHRVEPTLLASALSAILFQRSVRLLCDDCKEPYSPKPEFLRKANLPPEKVDVFYRRPQNPERVCPRCGGSGFVGRTGIFELLVVTEPIRELLRRESGLAPIKAEARKEGLIYVAEDGLRVVIQGRTSIEELLRSVKEGNP
jgi:type II secretory ATPase GspE/PulE/Tfp pilus assembly ATPase PilB-like protein